jgi:hypothetical protein
VLFMLLGKEVHFRTFSLPPIIFYYCPTFLSIWKKNYLNIKLGINYVCFIQVASCYGTWTTSLQWVLLRTAPLQQYQISHQTCSPQSSGRQGQWPSMQSSVATLLCVLVWFAMTTLFPAFRKCVNVST